jgi:hypothetical protein
VNRSSATAGSLWSIVLAGGEGIPFLGAEAEAGAVERAYTLAPTANFSKTVLVSNVRQLGVSRLPRMTWSDWGTPDRVIATLRREGLTPSWLQELAPTA